MKKNIFTTTLLLGVFCAGAVFISSCAKQQGPLSPDTSLIGIENSNATSMPKVIGSNITGGGTLEPAQELWIDFDMDMDAASFSSSTVKIYYMLLRGSAPDEYVDETEYVNVGISYNSDCKRLILKPVSGTWSNNTAFRVLLTNGVKNRNGRALDGNANNIAEVNAFDRYTKAFNVGIPSEPGFIYAMAPFDISAITVNAGGTTGVAYDLTGTMYTDNVPAHYRYITITVQFAGRVDEVSGQTCGDGLLMDDTNNIQVTPIRVERFSNSLTANYSLVDENVYKVILSGGINGLRSGYLHAHLNVPVRGRYFDGNNNGIAEASDDLVRYFTTRSGISDMITPPTVSSVTYREDLRRWRVVFAVPTLISGNDRMDAATLTVNNLQMRATYNLESYNIQPKNIEFDGSKTVDVFVPDAFYPSLDYASPAVHMVISRNVKSVEGLYLDGSGDAVGGQSNDDFISSPDKNIPSIDNTLLLK
ncbi:hypothetical protein KAR10_06970 [bacterium]|nr:hypothetical protein [bacterium]